MRPILVVATLLAATASPAIAGGEAALVSVCFVPGEDCEGRIAAAIGEARDEIHVQAYGFSSSKILRALRDAAARGVHLYVILDKVDNEKRYSGAEYMRLAGARVWIDDKVRIAHNKVIVIDDWLTIGGSFNYTKSAQAQNGENVTFIEIKATAGQFLDNWQSRVAVSDWYDGQPAETAAAPAAAE